MSSKQNKKTSIEIPLTPTPEELIDQSTGHVTNLYAGYTEQGVTEMLPETDPRIAAKLALQQQNTDVSHRSRTYRS